MKTPIFSFAFLIALSLPFCNMSMNRKLFNVLATKYFENKLIQKLDFEGHTSVLFHLLSMDYLPPQMLEQAEAWYLKNFFKQFNQLSENDIVTLFKNSSDELMQLIQQTIVKQSELVVHKEAGTAPKKSAHIWLNTQQEKNLKRLWESPIGQWITNAYKQKRSHM